MTALDSCRSTRHHRDVSRLAAIVLWLVAGCAGVQGPTGQPLVVPPEGEEPPGFRDIDGVIRPDPVAFPELWPDRVESQVYPITVRYSGVDERSMAVRVTRYLEQSWRANEAAGLRPPFAHGADGAPRFSAYLWHELGVCTAVAGSRAEGASWEAHASILILDVWSGCAGEHLDAAVAHAFHQAVTLAYDPWEDVVFRTASATFAEDRAFDEDNRYIAALEDFQSNPERAITHRSAVETGYAYGAALFLVFLSERYHDGGTRFLGGIWEAARGSRGSGSIHAPPAATTNNPTWAYGLELSLPAGVSLGDALVDFAQWRWFVGRRARRGSFSEGALFGAQAEIEARPVDVDAAPEIQSHVEVTGTRYFLLESGGVETCSLEFEGDNTVEWVVHTEHGDRLNGGTITLSDTALLVMVTAVPRGILDVGDGVYEALRFRMTLCR